MKAKKIANSAVIAAIYVTLTILIAPISYGPLQFRPAEALTVLACVFPEAIIGVTIGCLISNMFSPFGVYDIIFGTLITFFAAILTWVFRKNKFIAAAPPVVLNALFLPLIWIFIGAETTYWLNVGLIFASQAAVIYLLGVPLSISLDKRLKHIIR